VTRALAAALVVAGLAACAGGGDDATTPTSSITTMTTTSTTAPEVEGRVTWLCHPDVDDACEHDMDATVVEADGTTTAEPFVAADAAPIDCFYVYPTVSNDPGDNSDLDPGPEEESVVRQQAARLGRVCDVHAPVYRQATLTSLRRADGGFFAAYPAAYDDVLAAWREYLELENDGRGVVLLGHSQGAAHLLELLRDEIDPDPAQRALVVSAALLGTSVHASELPHVPPCERDGQTGCVLSWSTFRDTAPPGAGSFFARPAGEEPAICTNPAALGGGSAELHPYFSAAAAGAVEVDTEFVTLPGLVTGECRDVEGFHHLAITVHEDPGPRADDVRGDLGPAWGLHLIDVNVAMGDLVAVVGAQAEGYSAG
jgi:hypothetical protein